MLLPLLGIQNLILLGASIHALLGTLILLRSKWLTTRFASRLVVGFLAVVGIYLGCGGPWDKRVLTSGSFYREPFESYVSAAEYKRGFKSQDLLFYEDDANATISVHEYQSGTRVLRVNGKADASSTGDLPTQVLLGQLPMLLRPDSERVLLIGLGSGVTAGSILLHPIAQLETIEISRAVAQASEYFAPVQMAELNDPRHTVVFEDAKSYLQLTPVGLDVVISEPSNPWIAGIGNLFSIEFYTAVAARLKPDGLMVQWIHSYSLNDDLLRLILRTFTSVFPEVSVWSTISNDSSGGDYILIGSRQPIEPDFDAISELFRSEPTKRDLKRLGINTLPTLLSLQTLDSQQVASLISDGALNSDRFPLLEYSAPKALFAGEKAELFSKNDIRLQHLKDPRLISVSYTHLRAHETG